MALFATSCFAHAAHAVGDVVISQVWGGNNLNAALPQSDYVELYNRTAAPIDLTGWSINVQTATGTGTWSTLGLTGNIGAYSYYLIRVTAGTGTGTPLPGFDATYVTFPTSLSSTSGKVALRNVTGAISGACPPAGATLVDLLTYGSTAANTCPETTSAGAGSSTLPGNTPHRNGGGCVDTDNNLNDFSGRVPNPRWSGSGSTGGCTLGACCDGLTGLCLIDSSFACTSSGGSYQGDATTCPQAACVSGACCNGTSGTTCTAPRSPAACSALTNGILLPNSTCSPSPCVSGSCCIANGDTTCCTNVFSGLCIQQGGVAGPAGVTCTTAPTSMTSNCIPVPANDLCANAIDVTAGNLYFGNNFNATSVNDGPTAPNGTTRNTKGVWYKFTPATTSVFDVSTCVSSFDTMLQIFTLGSGGCADTSTWSYVAGDDDRCDSGGTICTSTGSSLAGLVSGVAMESGTTYYIRISYYTTTATAGGNYQLVVSDVGGAFGACCLDLTGECQLRSATGCTSNVPTGIYAGDGTTCTTNPCVPTTPVGACCSTAGACYPRQQSACTSTNVWQGASTTCFPDPCITGACCSSSGACTITAPAGCTGTSFYVGDDTVCSPSPCITGACCSLTTGACSVTLSSSQGGCTSGTYQTDGSVCTAGSNPCVPANDECTGAIALSLGSGVIGSTFGATQSATASLCSSGLDVFYSFTPTTTGTYRVLLTPSTTSLSLAIGTICPTFDDNTFCLTSSTTPRSSGAITLDASTTYYIRPGISGTTASGASFDLIVEATLTGACCNNTTGVCTLVASLDGCPTTATYQGDNSSCSPDPCPKGACCNNTSGACTITAPQISGGCSTGTYQGDNTTCDPTPCPPQGICCNQCTFACTVTVEPSCDTGTSVWDGGTTACSPTNICRTYGAAPANDGPCGAIPLSLGVQVIGTMKGSTDTDDNTGFLGCAGTTGTSGPALWYSFQPTTTGYHSFTTCGATFDCTMFIMTGVCTDVPGMTVVICDDDSCAGGTAEPVVCGTASSSGLAAVINFVWLESTTNYFIRVRSYSSTTIGGTFPLTVNTTTAGACCTTAGACSTTLESACTGTSVFLGNATVCGTDPCPAAGSCCNNCTYACSLSFESNCNPGTSTFTSGGSCTTGSITCLQGAAPANDLATGAIALTVGNAASGTLFTATSTDDGPQSTCDAAASKGVWYSFTPGVGQGGSYSIGTCGSTFSNVVTVLTGDPNVPASMTIVACDDDTCIGGASGEPVVCGTGTSSTAAGLIPTLTLTEGVTYYIRVQVDGATATGAGTLSVSVVTANPGACCTSAGACSETIASLCTGTSVFVLGQTCGANPCPPTGGCCNACGTCTITFATTCTGTGFTYLGNGSTCTGGCTGAGLPANDVCANATVISSFPYLDSQCTEGTTDDGPPGTCDSFGATIMTYSVWYRYTSTVDGILDVNINYIDWAGGNRFSYMHATPTPDCPTTQSTEIRCGGDQPDHYVVNTTAGMTYWICVGDEGTIHDADEGGIYALTVNFTPNANPGVCCRGATCSTAFVDAAACAAGYSTSTGAVTKFVPNTAACNTPVTTPGMLGNTTSPCCYANYNHNASLEVQDIFDFLNDWFAGNKAALVGGDGSTGTLSVQNIFDFLNAWFAGGCN